MDWCVEVLLWDRSTFDSNKSPRVSVFIIIYQFWFFPGDNANSHNTLSNV